MLELWKAYIKTSFEVEIVLQFQLIKLFGSCGYYEHKIIVYYLLIRFLMHATDIKVKLINF